MYLTNKLFSRHRDPDQTSSMAALAGLHTMRNRYLRLLPSSGLLLLFLPLGFAALETRSCAWWCPPKPPCINADNCRCFPGFGSSSEVIFTGPLESCDDIKECGPSWNVSSEIHIDCQDFNESYSLCKKGNSLLSREMFVNECRSMTSGLEALLIITLKTAAEKLKASDPTECAQWCPPNSKCVNANI
ncbi:adhesion G protein-coupled receptor E2-like [Sus scrofa]|uniref:adhesion G protein-coupled receptor E2-like n=1 Tax=Sus scrofa TaxID=9823 RepID=UPI000A2B455D|nr:adhesion G protein-coupled receptor E2-like [Sus scrofa]